MLRLNSDYVRCSRQIKISLHAVRDAGTQVRVRKVLLPLPVAD
jgi:hypothetical protein